MNEIIRKKQLNPSVTLMEVAAPLVAKKAEPGQFIILRVDEKGERIPLTVADYDREKGTITIIFQIVGATTEKLNHLEEGDYIHDFVGPLGRATHTEGLKKVAVVGGGVGCAIAYPVTKKLFEQGTEGGAAQPSLSSPPSKIPGHDFGPSFAKNGPFENRRCDIPSFSMAGSGVGRHRKRDAGSGN